MLVQAHLGLKTNTSGTSPNGLIYRYFEAAEKNYYKPIQLDIVGQNTIQHNAKGRDTKQYNLIRYNTTCAYMQNNVTMWYDMLQQVMRNNTTQFNMKQRGLICDTKLYDSMWYHTNKITVNNISNTM